MSFPDRRWRGGLLLLPFFAVLAAPAIGLEVAGCGDGPTAAPPAPAVGPAPLRRLTNTEYLNALHDLFPGLSVQLPALPADLTVDGFDNAAEAQEPSDVLIARYEGIANLIAQAATADPTSLTSIVGCTDWSTPAKATTCATQFLQQTGGRLFRRPLTADESSRFLLRFQAWQGAVDFAGAVQLTLSAMLQSPQFVYRAEPIPSGQKPGSVIPVDPYALASRLSFFLWESVPDDALLGVASRDELRTDEHLRAQVARMLADDRSKRAFWTFTREWLGLDAILLTEGAVRSGVDPQWTTATQASASRETELFVENVLGQGGTLRDLLTSRQAWVDEEMARVYGLPAPTDPSAWVQVSLPQSERAGLYTRVAYLAGYSHAGATSPPVRGNAIQLRLLCELPESPPPGANLSQPMAAPDAGPQTNRELFEARTSPAACQACHVSLNGLGFGLENYNAAGHYQTTDNGLPVDATGFIHGTDVDGPFTGAIALSEALSRSAVVHQCATQELVRFAFGRAPAPVEMPTIVALSKGFLQSGGDLRELMTDVILSPSFRMRLVEGD
jgi:hypothetical protein